VAQVREVGGAVARDVGRRAKGLGRWRAGRRCATIAAGKADAVKAGVALMRRDHLHVGALVYPGVDQLDFTGPFEVLARLPDSTFHVLWKEKVPVRDVRGLLLSPEGTLADAPPLDALVVPGGPGQEGLMDDEVVLSFLRRQAAGAQYVLSVCTGALVCGAAGLLKGVRATTHWSALDLLPYFGATPVGERVVVDGRIVSAAGVTSGIDAALRVAALLRGEEVAREIELAMEYAPEPPFASGTPARAAPAVLESARESARALTEARLATARRVAARLGVKVGG
jgi:cyclohexyl-isocyanide hydratase